MPESKRSFSEDDKIPSVKKRKYRKHPKPDANAPKKPSPSAYHLFALEQGEKLRKKGFGFEDIARETGSMWRALSPNAVNDLEGKTTHAKNQYRKDLSAYKKSSEYKAYQDYLKRWMANQETKKKHPSIQATKKVTPPPLKPSPTIVGSSSPLSTSSLIDEMPVLDWSSSTSSTSPEVENFMTLANSWFFAPELSAREQFEWKYSADCQVTLAPDPLFPLQHVKSPGLTDTMSTSPFSSMLEPSLLSDSNNFLTSSNSYTFC